MGIRERNTYIGIYRGEDTCRGRRAELKTYIGGGRGVRVGSDWVCGQIRKVVYSWVWIRGIGDKFRSLRGVGGVVEGRAMAMGDSSRGGSFGCWVVAWPRSLHLPYRRHIGSFDRIGVGCVSMLTTGGGVSMSLGTCAGSAHVQGIVGTGVVGVDSVVSLAVDGGVSRPLGTCAGSAHRVLFGVVGGVDGGLWCGWSVCCWAESWCWSLRTDSSISSQLMPSDFSGVAGANK